MLRHSQKKNTIKSLNEKINKTDFIFHLAGVNRSKIKKKFKVVNIDLTKKICETLSQKKKKVPIFFSSSTKVKSYKLFRNQNLLLKKF